jgi:hypothetical protein
VRGRIGCRWALLIGAALASCDSHAPTARDASVDAAPDAALDDAAPHAAPAEALGHCDPLAANPCLGGVECVEGCPYSARPGAGPRGGLCRVPGREQCGCGIIPDPCTTPGLDCLMPACCDDEGLCVTSQEKATICAGPDAFRFECGP